MKIILYFLAIATLFIIFQIYIFRIIKELRYRHKPESYSTLMRVLDDTIDRELSDLRITYDFKSMANDTKVLPKFQNDLYGIANTVITSFGEDFLKELQRYYTLQYIIRYIVKRCEMFIFSYINKNKIKTK